MNFQVGHIYHIYNQGNNRQRIFFDERNYIFFKEKIRGCILPFADILAWCLMQMCIRDRNKGVDKRIQAYQWRVDALTKQLTKEEVAHVISDLNGTISNSSGYLGSISDRSKELYFTKQTVGQYLIQCLKKSPHNSLKNQVFYRQDYLDEFNRCV